MATTTLTATAAASAGSFVSKLGINTHIDFNAYGYQNITNVINDINYLGVKIIRDSMQNPTDLQTWLQVSQATGAKFVDYIGETSPEGMQVNLNYMPQLAQEGILAFIEGGNEEDDAYPASLGNNIQITAQFQQQVYALGQQLGLPVINMSFGAGWTWVNNYQGDYDKVGDLSAYTNYANAHTYPIPGQLPDDTIQRLNGLANLAASTRPVITTEIGWEISTFDQQTIAKYVLDAAMDGAKDGDLGMYYYAMFDDMSGNWGMFNADNTPRPAAIALHNLTTLLADTGANAATFTPGSLTYSLGGTQTGDNAYLIEKSNGSFWLSLWNETEAANSPHTVTVTLGGQAASVIEFDPLTGTSSIQSWSNVSSVQLALPDHPVLLEVIPTTSGGTPAPTPPVVTVPASESVTAGTTTAITGVSVADSTTGNMTLNLTAGSGLLTITDASGNQAPGSGTHSISFTGTLTQLQTELAHLFYTAAGSAGSDSITVDVRDQAGLDTTKSIAVTVAAPVTTTTPALTGPLLTVPASQSVTVGTKTTISGISLVDDFAATCPGTLALNLSAGSGLLTITDANGNVAPGSGTHSIRFDGTLAQLQTELAHLSYTAGSSAGSDTITVDVWDQPGMEGTKSIAVTVAAAAPPPPPPPTGPALTVPATLTLATGTTASISGASVTDAYAATSPGNMTLNLKAGTGMLSVTNSSGSLVSGSGTHAISLQGTLTQINYDLSHLSYTAGATAGTDSLSVDIWDQAGMEAIKSVAVSVQAPASTPTTSITIAATDANPVIMASHATISATSGNHMIFIGGSYDVLSATGGTETVMAFQGHNTITTGKGNDKIQIAGSGNVVNAGAGTNEIDDSGTANRLVMPRGGQGLDNIFGYVLQNQDTIDLRSMLAGTQWNHTAATLGNYVGVRTVNGADTVISVTPSGVAGSTHYDVATLHGTGPVDFATLIAHSLT
jgi:serralysin